MTAGLRLALTGATGNLGREMLKWALNDESVAQVTALGRRPTGVNHPKLGEAFLDLSGRVDLKPVADYDALVHFAFSVEEPRDKKLAYRINVTSTRALLDEAQRVGIGHLILTSSANALGNANCGTGRACSESSYPAGDADTGNYYFHHKALMEHLANWHWATAASGGMKLAVVRLCYIVGQHFDNSGLKTLLGRVVVFPQPTRSCYQFLWDSDAVQAYAVILGRGLCGVYNVAPVDHTSVADIAQLTGARLIPAPLGASKLGVDLLFRLHLAPFSAHWVSLGDPVLDSRLLRSTTDWRPSMSSQGALQAYVRTRRDDAGSTRVEHEANEESDGSTSTGS